MCIVVCCTILNAKDAKELRERIDDEYRVKMILDNVPPLDMPYNRSYTDSSEHQHVLVGMKVQYDGGKPEHKYFVNNHLTSTIKYHKDVETDAARTVGFEVKQFSVMHEYECKDDKIRLTNCTVTGNDSPLEVEDENGIIFTYDVECQESEINWASRLDTYHYMLDSENNWLSVLISLFAVILPSVMVADIMPCDVTSPSTTNWKLKKKMKNWMEVSSWGCFRHPTNSDLLCVYAGTSVQCFGMILVTMVFAALGFLSLRTKGSR